jgi:hypothetical protein
MEELRDNLTRLDQQFASMVTAEFDSLIVCTVLNRHHEVFSEYCHFRKISWAEISFGPLKKSRQRGGRSLLADRTFLF